MRFSASSREIVPRGTIRTCRCFEECFTLPTIRLFHGNNLHIHAYFCYISHVRGTHWAELLQLQIRRAASAKRQLPSTSHHLSLPPSSAHFSSTVIRRATQPAASASRRIRPVAACTTRLF